MLTESWFPFMQCYYQCLYITLTHACYSFPSVPAEVGTLCMSTHTPSCGLPMIPALLKAQLHFAHKYQPEQD